MFKKGFITFTVLYSVTSYFAGPCLAQGPDSGDRFKVTQDFMKQSYGLQTYNGVHQFRRMREVMGGKEGAEILYKILEAEEIMKNGEINPGGKRFNPFARIVSGALSIDYDPDFRMEGELSEKYMMLRNRKDQRVNVRIKEEKERGNSAMANGSRHRLLVPKDMHWSNFNVLTMGYGGKGRGLKEAVDMLNEMEQVALEFAKKSGWSKNVGLYFHPFPKNSVQYLHLHVIDLGLVNEVFELNTYKNLPLDAVREQLKNEMKHPIRPNGVVDCSVTGLGSIL